MRDRPRMTPEREAAELALLILRAPMPDAGGADVVNLSGADQPTARLLSLEEVGDALARVPKPVCVLGKVAGGVLHIEVTSAVGNLHYDMGRQLQADAPGGHALGRLLNQAVARGRPDTVLAAAGARSLLLTAAGWERFAEDYLLLGAHSMGADLADSGYAQFHNIGGGAAARRHAGVVALFGTGGQITIISRDATGESSSPP